MPLFEDIVHKALASEMRREILLTLAKDDKYLTEISKELGKKPQTVDFHLTLLEEIGLVTSSVKDGKKYYSLKDKRILDFLRKERPLPPGARPKPPHEIMLDAWDDIGKRLDVIEGKLDKVLKKLK
ncbi:MAG: winged helix-turn-helix transcriptional regulator [Candidatus Aenigmarchaeota archaeon]|nr:winged helix-turn-helix transcriptional regulator [Candidatus Aenigmarchaeota archaeon]